MTSSVNGDRNSRNIFPLFRATPKTVAKRLCRKRIVQPRGQTKSASPLNNADKSMLANAAFYSCIVQGICKVDFCVTCCDKYNPTQVTFDRPALP